MNTKLTSLEQLRKACVEMKGITAKVADMTVDALEEMSRTKQDVATAVTIEHVNEAIRTAIAGALEEAY